MKFKKLFLILLYSFISFIFSNDKIGYVYYIEGESYIKNNKINIYYKEAISGRDIYSGDVIKVNQNSKCSIYFDDEKTQLVIDGNSRIQIIETNLSREIKIDNGSVYVHNLYDSDKKFYAITHNNQYFLENDRAWIKSDFFSGDLLYSLDYPIDVYSNINHKSIQYQENEIHYFFNSGKISHSNITENIVPDYVLNKSSENVYESTGVSLSKHDLIPIYGDRIRDELDQSVMKYTYSLGTLQLNDDSYINIEFHSRYKHNNLSFGFKLDPSFNSEGELLSNDWEDAFDIIDRFYLNYLHLNKDKNNEMYLHIGDLNNVSLGHGYLIDNIKNNLDYPRLKKTGLFVKYKFGDDFMDFDLLIPDLSDFMYSGGVIAARTSLFLSHRFPLTLGLGLISDFNQFSFVKDQYGFNFSKKRSVSGVEFDYNYHLFDFNKLNVSLYGEVVGIWYPESIYYVLFDNANSVGNDLRYRKGVWGLKSPGIHLDFKNRLDLKIAYHQNSALFIPSYFNSTYLMNRTRYFTGELDFPLVDQQIDLFNEFQINGDPTQFMIPIDMYPLLFQNEGISTYQVKGFSTEINYEILNYFNFMFSAAIYTEDSDASNSFYSIETVFSIKDKFIKRISFLDLYYSNEFFTEISDKQRMHYGLNFGIKLPLRLSLIFDVGQLYYDSNFTDNKLEQMTNSSFSLKYNF